VESRSGKQKEWAHEGGPKNCVVRNKRSGRGAVAVGTDGIRPLYRKHMIVCGNMVADRFGSYPMWIRTFFDFIKVTMCVRSQNLRPRKADRSNYE